MLTIPGLQHEFDALAASKAAGVVITGLPRYLLLYGTNSIAEQLRRRLTLLRFRTLEEATDYIVQSSGKENGYKVEKGKQFDRSSLQKLNLERTDRVWNGGEYSLYGDVAVVWPEGFLNPIRISLFGDEVESIHIVDAQTRRTMEQLESVHLTSSTSEQFDGKVLERIDAGVNFPEALPITLLYSENATRLEASDLKLPHIDLGIKSIPLHSTDIATQKVLENVARTYVKSGFAIKYYDRNIERYHNAKGYLKNMAEYTKVDSETLELIPKGFIDSLNSVMVLTPYEMFGEIDLADQYHTGGKTGSSVERVHKSRTDEIFKKVSPGEYIVHEDHGVGLYNGVVEREEGVYMMVQYAGKDRLLIPLTYSGKLTKYVGGSTAPKLTSLNSGAWRRIRKKAEEDAEKLASELIQLYAVRKITQVDAPSNGMLENKMEKFIDLFPYHDTEDQIVATEEIVRDMKRSLPMDRLLVGDVGFGKTEVAMRAIYMAILQGKQVAMLSPTTVLVEQHRSVLEERFAPFDVKVESYSRFLTEGEKKRVVEKLKKGDVDILIGTHALLSDDVEYKNLGLIVVDEEQKFGVRQKEKLKQKRLEAHFLALSATPIPRTLNMALSGVRDISIISTPPHGRKPIQNNFARFSWDIVNKAVSRELEREGQVFFLHNRVGELDQYVEKLQNYFPEYIVAKAHGRMSPKELGSVMYKFSKGAIDILVCTTIIENGIDLPNVNTLIVNRSERFGLAQLYQIRGRIGRGERQAYAYFLHRELVGDSGARLEALNEAEGLGSGYLIANRDMEIRGVGEILGREQSGAISKVGYGMFMSLLQEKVSELKESVKE